MKVEVQYINGCPNHWATVELIRQVMGELAVNAELLETEIADFENAHIGFLGSPTVRVNGLDVEPAAWGSSPAGYGCRSYANGSKRQGFPSAQMIRDAIDRARAV